MDNEQLLNRGEVLEKCKDKKTRQQISYPLDQQSIIILNNCFMHITNTVFTLGGACRSANTGSGCFSRQRCILIQYVMKHFNFPLFIVFLLLTAFWWVVIDLIVKNI